MTYSRARKAWKWSISTYVQHTLTQSLLLQRLSFFVLQGNLQIDGGSTTYNVMGAMHLGQKLIEVIKDMDFFKDTKMYDDEI